MNPVAPNRAEEILRKAQGKKVAVLGDFMLDRHLKGSVRRISPEAPVPVVEIEAETTGLGGAGNVVNNLASLGAQPVVFGVIGDDATGQVLLGHLETCGTITTGIIASPMRKTTEKIRIIAHDQHVVRADRETPVGLSAVEEKQIMGALEAEAQTLSAIILQDYNKGVLTERSIAAALEIAAKRRIPVYVDPKFDHFFDYRGSHLFKPNIRELETALGMRIGSDQELQRAGGLLFDRMQTEFVLVTRGEKGMTLFLSRDDMRHVPTRAKKVHDVSGAGDTVIATYVVAELGGGFPQEAAVMANEAAGVVCGEVGVVSIERDRLLEAVADND